MKVKGPQVQVGDTITVAKGCPRCGQPIAGAGQVFIRSRDHKGRPVLGAAQDPNVMAEHVVSEHLGVR